MTGFCLKCRKHVDIKDPMTALATGIGKLTLKGLCPSCGSSIYRISNLDRDIRSSREIE